LTQSLDFSIVQLRDHRVFEQVFKLHYAALAGFAFQYVGDRDIAEELVQETFTNLWSKAEAIRVETTLKSYLYGAVRNACLNHLKHQKVKLKYTDRMMHAPAADDAVDLLELDQLESQIKRALEKIPEKCRQIFELSRIEGKRYQEIADELRLSLKTVENQMGKALKILRNELKDYLPLILWLASMGVKLCLIVAIQIR